MSQYVLVVLVVTPCSGPFWNVQFQPGSQRRIWWRHQMEIFSALLVLCAGNSSVTGEFPAQRPVTRSFDVFFDLHLNKRLSKQSWDRWFETPSRSLWRHRNEISLGQSKTSTAATMVTSHVTNYLTYMLSSIVLIWVRWPLWIFLNMMTSSNGNIFRVTGHLCGPRWIPHIKGQWRGALMFSLICIWISGWVNNGEAGDLRRYRAHYDVTVMKMGVHYRQNYLTNYVLDHNLFKYPTKCLCRDFNFRIWCLLFNSHLIKCPKTFHTYVWMVYWK